MFKNLVYLAKKFLPSSLYENIRKVYRFLKEFNIYYNKTKDLNHNETIFLELGINLEDVKSELKKFKIDYNDSTISWHYHLFLSLKQIFKKKNKKVKNILEIGTFLGEFTNFLSKVYPESIVTTIDLKQDDKQFIETYNRNDKKKLKKFLDIRNKNIMEKNINFLELNSNLINESFKNIKFDLIWIDGDHLDPQATKDIKNSLNLIDNSGIICVDDIIKNKNFIGHKTSDETYKTLSILENQKIIKNYYIIKRLTKNNLKSKKYISISFKN